MRNYRLATEEDAEKLLDLTLRAYEPIRELGINFAAATADLAFVKKNVRNNMCYVLEEDGNIIATASLRMPWGPQPGPFEYPHIWWFAVDPSYGKKGIGSLMMEWLENTVLSETLKCPAVSLGTADKHPWLIEMYERKGYEKAGSQDLGKGHITVYLVKKLREDFQ
ncbi:GNAT family N-acetyltransferase [Priestia filamentosa]|uniref:GNAT family N-acetyltransferase n=1 Tax=Priestia TaxID=2800373 RepID=UPI001FB373A1|nr:MULTISPECIES: GNAT family N-acetyltransferase [Priestia]MCY8233167.1 GNAT family N-acetyltransferase [Priestia endophytica]MED3729186.1 GNAT family N-acetyltransferase [Priestia filamentosa]UOE59074.1 GNAT family N-acetyltransferase [Priestia filamentosa]